MKVINQKDTELVSISTSKGNQTKFKIDFINKYGKIFPKIFIFLPLLRNK